MVRLGNHGQSAAEATLVSTPADMARVLFNASACSAAAYALAAHETACEGGDPERVRFWDGVCGALDELRAQLDEPRARRVA